LRHEKCSSFLFAFAGFSAKAIKNNKKASSNRVRLIY